MAVIKASIDKAVGLTTITVSGKLEAGELTSFAEANDDGRFTNRVLWDFRDADITGIGVISLRAGVANWSQNTKKGDSQAFVFSRDVDFGIGRMIHAYSQIEAYKSEINIFRDVNKATEWLMESQTEQK